MKKYIPVSLSLVPLFVSSLGAVLRSVPLMILSVLLLFVMVHVLPFCKKRENIYMFIYCAVTVIPINIFVIRAANPYIFFDEDSFRICLERILLFFILLALEETILGCITRLLWKRQYKLPDFNE